MDEDKQMLCPICLEKPKMRFTLECDHTFCLVHIHKWSLKNKTCPCCRKHMENVFEKYGNIFISTCRRRVKEINKHMLAGEKDEEIKQMKAFFKFVASNRKVLTIIDGNTDLLRVCIIKHAQLSEKHPGQFDDATARHMVKSLKRLEKA